ncbi:helix-turn-helix transcriptional regulator [Tateyamaria sp. syn59]|uniref:helix-turn-helix transcriptional regulator n=1 Tax=Tateyamaria sp. syn59 TaxID=2576942 RepID=UPI0011BD5424|nr:helix-turn-helix transcriptional regulator [Tateyamaria sp. syn59]
MAEPVDERLGNALKSRRKAAGLTQAELAHAINVSRKTINTIENRVFIPSTLLALKLARHLGCSTEDLFFLISDEADST